MSVIVFGNGRCGTNVALEILAGHSKLHSYTVEDKLIFRNDKIRERWDLTKSDIHYCNWEGFDKKMTLDPDMKIIWCIRDPRDQCMSKIYRGQPGHDCGTLADDARPTGCVDDMNKMFDMYIKAVGKYAGRILTIKMEDMILDIHGSIKRMCDFLDIDVEPDMDKFYLRMRNVHKKKRYKTIDKSQVGLHKRCLTVYDGYFRDKSYTIKTLFDKVDYIREHFGYE